MFSLKIAKGNSQLRFSANKNVVASLSRKEALQLITEAWTLGIFLLSWRGIRCSSVAQNEAGRCRLPVWIPGKAD